MLLIHITAAYSNAVLVAILPHISDSVGKLNLPISEPIAISQISHASINPYQDQTGCGVWLTNHYWFGFVDGYMNSFRSPTNWFNNNYDNWDDVEYFKRYAGKENMTTNEAIELARDSFYRLGYKRKNFDIERPPTIFDGPENLKRMNLHLPYCRIEWDSPDSKIQSLLGLDYNIQFDVNMQQKQIVGMNLSGRKFFRPNPKIDVVPKLETDYKRSGLAGQFAQLFNREPRIYMTSAYSNATLKATLSYVADFAKRLKLPVTQPLATSQVLLFRPPLYTNSIDTILMLTNHYWFHFAGGFIFHFSSPDDWFDEAGTRTDWPRFDAKTCMTTNEAIEFARHSFRELGYNPEEFHLDIAPTFENALDKKNERYAYCQIDWTDPEYNDGNDVEFDIDMLKKRVVGMNLSNTNFIGPLPKINVVPELESDYRKRTQNKMFFRSNAPLIFGQAHQ